MAQTSDETRLNTLIVSMRGLFPLLYYPIILSLMVRVFMQISFMQLVMRMEFCLADNGCTIIMFVHEIRDMSSKSSACITTLVISSIWDATLNTRDL